MKPGEVKSAREWISLTEPDFPVLSSRDEQGAIYEVSDFGYYPASKAECVAVGIQADQPNDAMGYALPMAYVKIDQEFELCRLPIGLTSWVLRAILITQRGLNPLPAKVEFGEIDGKVFAEIRF